jgi:hypothetical protein
MANGASQGPWRKARGDECTPGFVAHH